MWQTQKSHRFSLYYLMLKQNKKHKETGRNKKNPNKQTMKRLKGDGKDG